MIYRIRPDLHRLDPPLPPRRIPSSKLLLAVVFFFLPWGVPAVWAEHNRTYTFCLLALACPAYAERKNGANVTWPSPSWNRHTPAEVGLNKDELIALSRLVGGDGIVIRHGHVVHTWGQETLSSDVGSAMKPVLSFLLLVALEEGLIESIDEPVVEYEPRLAEVPGGERITWRHLANQTSGYGLSETPGQAYAYNDYAIALYYDVLMDHVYQQHGDEVLRTRLAEPLGFEDDYTFEAFGPDDRPGRLALSVRDFARFGLMYLRGGRWGRKQLVAPELIEESLSDIVPPDTPLTRGERVPMLPNQRSIGGSRDLKDIGPGFYTFNWWVNNEDADGQQLFVDAPCDTYLASGHLGKRNLWIIPSHDLIVVWNRTHVDDLTQSPGNPDTRSNRAVQLMVAAAQDC